jgi:hypothetical protein
MTDTKVHHQTERGARIALAKKQISRASYEAVLRGEISLAQAKELGREGAPGAHTSRSDQDEARTAPGSVSAERPQAGTGAQRACLCGCREPVRGKKSRFRPGHDARLYGELKRNLEKDPLLRNERFNEAQREYARERGLV